MAEESNKVHVSDRSMLPCCMCCCFPLPIDNSGKNRGICGGLWVLSLIAIVNMVLSFLISYLTDVVFASTLLVFSLCQSVLIRRCGHVLALKHTTPIKFQHNAVSNKSYAVTRSTP